MSSFDLDGYFARRNGNVGTDKIDAVAAASQEKLNALNAYRASKSEPVSPSTPRDTSWVAQMGLDPNSFGGGAVNLAASLGSGTTRVAGQLASLPSNALAVSYASQLDDRDNAAYGRYMQGAATPEDLAILSNTKGGPLTVMQLFERANQTLQEGKAITNFMDTSGIVHQGKRDRLNRELGNDFQGAWDQTKQGASALAAGNVLSGAVDAVSGIARLGGNAAHALVTNPGAVAEYAVENTPQLVLGAAGKVGKAALGASNVGYGAEHYQKGIDAYQKAGDGSMPSVAQRQDMALHAALAVGVEQASDLFNLGAMKAAKKAVDDAARTGFKESLKNITKAGGKGFASEAPTEAFQTYAEGEASLDPASDKDIYIGGVIGGAAGGVITGTGRAVAELAQATPEHAQKRAQEQADTEAFVEASHTGNTDAYLDESSKGYNPVKAVAVLFAHNQAADTTPEAKQQNVEKAHDIIAGLETKRTELQNQLDQMTPEGLQTRIDSLKGRLDNAPPELASRITEMVQMLEADLASFDPQGVDPKNVQGLKNQITSLDRQIAESAKLRDQLAVETKPQEEDILAAVEQADSPISTSQPEAAKAAADHVVSLAMTHPDSFSDDHLNRLANNQNNGLTPEQRTYLRTLSESRIAENAMKTLGIVENEVMNGDPAKNQLGIRDYKQRMQAAITSRNEEKATTAVHMLGKFANAHKQKLRFFMDQFAKASKAGVINVVPTNQGWQLAPTQDVSAAGQAANRKLGGMTIHKGSAKLIRQIQAEAKALGAAHQQLQAVYALRFNQQQGVTPVAQTTVDQSGTTQAANSSTPSQAQETAPVTTTVDESVNTQSTQGQNQSNVDSTVDSETKASKPKKPRQRIEPKDYQNIVGAILKVTGGEGISSKVARDLLGDNTKHLKNIRPAVRANGWQDIGQLVTHLREAGYTQLQSEQGLVDMLRNHMNGVPGRTAAQIEEEAAASAERKAKEEGKSFRKAVNQEAKEKGIKQARGKRTLDDVLADLALWEAEQNALEAEEERIAIQVESAMSEADDSAEIMQELAEVVDYTKEEIERVRIENRKSEERTPEVPEGTPQEDRGDRADVGQTEEGKGSDGEAGKLSIFREVIDLSGKKFGEAFKGINLITHNLVQKVGKGKATQRPLVAIKDFLGQWASGMLSDKDIESFIGEAPSEVQQMFLDHFRTTAAKWLNPITQNLVKGQLTAGIEYKKAVAAANGNKAALAEIEKKFAGKKPGDVYFNENLKYTNPIQYLIELNESGRADMEENVKTAIAAAAYIYVAENAKAPQYSSPEDVKAMFGLSEYDFVGEELLRQIAPLGSMENVVILSMGQKVTQALGLSAKKDATQDFLARLEADLGAHVMKLLVDQGIMERTKVSKEDLSAGLKHLPSHDPKKQGDIYFLRMSRSEGKKAYERNLNATAQQISDLAKGTHGVLTRLFGVESQAKEPSWEPIGEVQQNTNKTDQAVPDELKKIIKHENSVANYVREDVWYLLQELGEQAFLEMAGYKEPDGSKMHHTTIEAIKVSNEALQRELEVAKEYFGALEADVSQGGSPLGLKQPLYLAHSIWKQQRVGIDSVINPQSSKIHRWMLTRADWNTTVKSTDKDMMDSFFLRVGEGLGVKTDKQGNMASLQAIAEMLNTQSQDAKTAEKAEVLQAAVDALVRSFEGTSSKEDKAAIVAGVKAGGEKMHSMDALIALAKYQKAKTEAKGKAFSFDVQLMGEVDGVTNGPMLSHLLMGAGKSAKDLLVRLTRGGFFEVGSGYSNYNVWRGEATHTDLYESTIGAVIKAVQSKPELAATYGRLQKITGTLSNKDTGKVEKAGRNIIKTPLTAMLFGSSVSGAVDSMFRDFVAKTYAGFEDIAKLKPGEQQQALKDYVENLNALLEEADVTTTRIPMMSLSDFLTQFELSESQTQALEAVFKDTLGVAVEHTMEKAYAPFLKMRDVINDAANTTFALYDIAYQALRQDVLNELIASGDVAVGKDGKPLHDLTPEQEKLIDDRVAALNPEVQTYMSKQSKNAQGAGLHISKSSRKISTEKAYANISRFGRAFPVKEGFGALSMGNAAFQRLWDAPGVAMVPMMIHSLDSAISHMALMARQVLNVHDAHGTGLKGFIETAQALNQATWKAVLGYSPAAEMRDSFRNTLFGMDDLLKSGQNKEAITQGIKKYMKELGNKYGTWVDGKKIPMAPEKVLIKVASQLFHAADKADRIKYEAMSQLQYVDQYALEGGQYEVTDADRAEAAKLLKQVGDGSMPGSVWAAIDRINEAVLGIKQTPVTSPYGMLGESSVASNGTLTRFFEDQETRTASEVIKQIEGMVSPANKMLLKKIQRLIDPKMPVQMVTARTKDGATISKEMGARGWFAYKGDASAVYVLSPEFKLSGLTPELLVHELLHAALARTIENPKTPEAKALVGSLDQLKNLVVAHLDAHPELKQQFPMKLDVHELVSWGMSDLAFQRDVLAQVVVQSGSGSKLTNALKRFVQIIASYLGLPLTVKDAQGNVQDNALSVLLQDVAALFEEAKNPKDDTATDSFSAKMEAIHNMTTQDVFEALDEGKVEPTFKQHLETLLEGITNKLHGPYGTFKEMVEQQMASTPKDLWQEAQGKGKAPFGSAALAANISMNDQVAFVLEQVEASVQGALEANTGAAHDVYVELNKLYQEARAKLENDPSLSQDLRDFLFKMDMGQGGRSRHLARFAAMGLAHPEVNKALKISTSRAPIATSGSFAHRLETLFQKVLEWFNGRLTHTFAGQDADAKLQALVTQLVEIEAKRKEPMLQKASALDFVENSLKEGAAKLKGKIEKAGRSDWVRDRKSSIVRAAGAVVSTVAGERTEAVMNHIQAIRDRQMNQGFGLAMGIVNEIRGMNDGNAMFHRLIREAKLREGIREDMIVHTGNIALESFANKGKDLTQKEKAAITAGLLRTDIAALLDHHTMDEIYRLLGGQAALDQEIARLESALAPYRKVRGYYERYAKNLGFKMASGKIKGMNTMMNASNIANLVGTGQEALVTQADVAVVVPIIDQLASLYAYRYTKPEHKAALATLLKTEAARGNASGVEMVIKLHKSLQQQSKDRLFEGSESLMMKGYTPEIYDPKREVVVATEQASASLIAQGFTKGKRVSTDPLDPDKQDRFVFKRDGGGLRPWLSGIMSYTGETAKGSRSRTDNVKNLADWKINQQDLRHMARGKKAAMQREFRYDPNYDPSKVEDNFAAPVVNPQGAVVDFRYLMAEDNKDDLLNRDSRFDKVLGSFAGNIYDKESTKESNRKAVQALRDQYQADFALRSESYRKVGPDSTDPELADIYRMLPEDTKQAIRDIWGTEHMMVRSDLMDINFGYRKVSMTDAFHKEHKTVADQLFTGLFTHVWGEKAEYNLRRVEDIWQEIVAETKEILVIKNLSTLIGNIGSNISLLYWQGVPLKDMLRYHRVALKGVSVYRADSAALIELETKLAAGIITTSRGEMGREIRRLQDSLANNPVKELIDAGLMPSIVEDVSPEDDMYSYKSRLTHYVEGHTNNLNKHVLDAVKVVYMAKDTKMYKALHHATQLSDFVARYALYAHVTSRKQNPLSKEEAVQLASDSFVNYDLPSHRKLQYMNDMGFVRFTKYYLRIQKVIAHLYAENPGRAMALLATEAFFSNAPMLTDSGFTHHMGNNPFTGGAVDYLGVLDELATVKLGEKLIK